MDRFAGKVAVVTGASVGIGASISKKLVERGVKVVGLARRVELMEDLIVELGGAPGKMFALKCDLASEQDILKAFQWVKKHLGGVHIMINNAGLITPTSLMDGSTDMWRLTFDVNVLATCICTREAIKSMQENNIAGHIINVSSIAGRYPVNLPVPNFNVYPATKYAINALTENLRQELRYHKSEIKVTIISPGVVRTDFHQGFVDDGTPEMMRGGPGLSAEDLADAMLYALDTPPHVQVHDLFIHPLGEVI